MTCQRMAGSESNSHSRTVMSVALLSRCGWSSLILDHVPDTVWQEIRGLTPSLAFGDAFIEDVIDRATVDLPVAGDGPDPPESAPLCDTLRPFVAGLRVEAAGA